jgi:hypothetical protein
MHDGMKLQNTVILHADETTVSFASRLAAANGIPTIAELLLDAEPFDGRVSER